MSEDKPKKKLLPQQEAFLESSHPNFGPVGENPEFDKKRLAGSRKGNEAQKRKAKIRKMLREDPAEMFEEALASYLADNPQFTKDLLQTLAEEAVKGDHAALRSMKDIYGYGAPKEAVQSNPCLLYTSPSPRD